MSDPNQQPRTVAESLYDAFGAGDIERIIGMLDEGVTWELVGPTEIPYFGRYEGRERVRVFFELLARWCIVERFEIVRIVATEDGAVAEGVEEGRYPDRGSYTMRWCHVMTVADGRITTFTDYLDTAPMLAAWRA